MKKYQKLPEKQSTTQNKYFLEASKKSKQTLLLSYYYSYLYKMNKKIESFLQDIHSLPDEKLDTKQLEANLEMLLSSSPEIKADEAFKSKLKARLAGIVEFKQ